MVDINVKELEGKINELSKIIQDYEFFTNSIYYEFQNISSYWDDNRKRKLYVFIDEEKKKNQQLVANMKEHYQVYKELYISYNQLGRKIKCNLDAKKNVLDKVNNVIEQMENVLSCYDNLGDLSFFPLKNRIYNEREILRNKINIMYSIRETITNYYSKIEEIEAKITQRISKNNITRISINTDVGRI